MSDTPKFEVIDRRKFKAAEEDREGHQAAHPGEPGRRRNREADSRQGRASS